MKANMLLGMIIVNIVHSSEIYLPANEDLARMSRGKFGSIAGSIPFLLLASSLNHHYRGGPLNERQTQCTRSTVGTCSVRSTNYKSAKNQVHVCVASLARAGSTRRAATTTTLSSRRHHHTRAARAAAAAPGRCDLRSDVIMILQVKEPGRRP